MQWAEIHMLQSILPNAGREGFVSPPWPVYPGTTATVPTINSTAAGAHFNMSLTTNQKLNEADLVLLIQQRQPSAFSYLYEHYSGALYTVITNIIPNEAQAADTLQEVFVKIWKQSASYDASKGRLFTWMLNIARNASIDVLRSKQWHNQQQNQSYDSLVHEGQHTAEMHTDKIGLRKVVHQLKQEYKVLIELAYFEGFTQDEIAKAQGIPLGTVKTRMRAALQQLRSFIKPG